MARPDLLVAAVALAAELALGAQSFDIVVYGGTAGSVVAAVAAAREGASVALLEPGRHLGGMTSGGLGRTDHGRKETIGGYSLEFYRRVGGHYGEPVTWYFEPHVAERALREMAREAGVRLFHEHRLREQGGVRKKKQRLTAILMENGDVFEAKVFIDATYEGDLMAAAGVSYTWGRESTTQYGESLAGVRPKDRSHQFDFPIPAHDEARQALADIQPGLRGELGAADRKVQAYNFRMCLSRDPNNQAAYPRPANYDPRRWELLLRYIQALAERDGRAPAMNRLVIASPLPNQKLDVNNRGPVSTDYIGASWDYPNATYAQRARIWQDHINYTAGFFWFLANDPRVPKSTQEEFRQWGLCADEFAWTNHWPHQLYVREARRMVGDWVMTQKDIQTDLVKADSVGMGSYNSDSHNVQRFVQPDGAVQNEGNMEVPVTPYQIPYRVMLPKRREAVNLLVPVCLSATHVTYSTLRMEPVYMILGQAAGVAAKMAIEQGVDVQRIDTRALGEKLRRPLRGFMPAVTDHNQLEDHGREGVPLRGVLPAVATLPNDDKLVVKDGRHIEGREASGSGNRPGCSRYQHASAAGDDRGWQLHFDPEGPHRNQFLNRSAPRARAGEVHQVQNQPPRLTIEVAIEESLTLHRQWNAFASDPSSDVREQISMVGEMLPRITAVHIGGHEGDARFAALGENQGGDVGFRLTHPGRLGRVSREGRNEGQWYDRVAGGLQRRQGPSIGNDVGFVEAAKHGVAPADDGRLIARPRPVHSRAQFRTEAQVRVPVRSETIAPAAALRQPAFGGGRQLWRRLQAVRAEQIRQGVVRARIAPFVVQCAHPGRKQRSAALDKAPDRRALPVGKPAHVGQNEHGELLPLAIDVVGVNRKIGNASANQRVHEARVRLVDELGRIVAPEEIGVSLGPHYADGGHRLPVHQVSLLGLGPLHDGHGCAIHAPVFVIRADVMPPRLNAASQPGDHPHARLGRRLTRQPVVARARLIQRHALRRQLFPAHEPVYALARIAVLLEPGLVVAALMIEHQDVGASGDLAEVAERSRLR